jgi:hydrogenase maturation protease
MADSAPSTPVSKLILVIGIGNEFRSDDAAGLQVAKLLKAKKPANAIIKEANGEGAVLLEFWKGFDKVIIIDATRSGAAFGTIHHFDITGKPLPRNIFHSCSSHAFGIIEAIEMGKVLNQLPKNLIIYGIEGKSFAMGKGISNEVQQAVETLAEQISEELNKT